jgi:glycosyltransferase involved in cell wall biosynthesis
MSKLKILGVFANEGGCAYYRLIMPLQKLAELYPNDIEVKFSQNPIGLDIETGEMPPDDADYNLLDWADVIWINNISNYGGPYTARVIGLSKQRGKFVHFDTDDLLIDLYDGHRLKQTYEDRNLYDITKWMYGNSDLVTVTQRKFAERVKPYVGGVLAVVKNSIDYNLPCWNMQRMKVKKLTRVGWAGGIHHEEDVKEFVGVPWSVNQKVGKENVQWDFYGAPAPPEEGQPKGWQNDVWDNYRRILLRGFKKANNWSVAQALPPDRYGSMYSAMDIAIAPLQMNAFNDSKSEIKVAECGRYKVPLIASNVGCYDETIVNGQTGFLIDPDAPKTEWVRILSKCIKNPKLVQRMGENLHEITEEYFDINKVVKHRLELYEECFKLLSERNKDAKYNKEWTFSGNS